MAAGRVGGALALLCVLALVCGQGEAPAEPSRLRAELLAGRHRAPVVKDDNTYWKDKYERLAALFRKRVGEDPEAVGSSRPAAGWSGVGFGKFGGSRVDLEEVKEAPPPPTEEMLRDLEALNIRTPHELNNERMQALVASRPVGSVERFRAEYMMTSFKFLSNDVKATFNITKWEQYLIREDAVLAELRRYLISISALGEGRWIDPPTYTSTGRTACLYSGVRCFDTSRMRFFKKRTRSKFYGVSSVSLTPNALPVGSMTGESVNHILMLVARLNNLRSLKVEGLTAARLEPAPFARMRLHKLTIANCQHLKSIPEEEFMRYKHLRKLRLSDISVDTLRPDLFKNMPRLRVVVFHQLKITSMPLIAHLNRLERLLISDLQHLREVPSLRGNKSLKVVEVTWAPIERLFDGIETVSTLTGIDVKSTLLKSLPEDIGQLQNLEALLLANNKLESIPKSLYKLPVKKLFLNVNSLESLPKGISEMKNLRILALNNNKLETLPEDLWGCPSLRSISAGTNRLRALPEADPAKHFNEVLISIDFADNELEEVQPIHARVWPSIVQISLGNNRLRGPVEFVGTMSHLMDLRLYGNPIGHFGKSWKGLKLTHLDLTECGLTNVPEYIGTYRFLKVMHLKRNKITSLPSSIGDLQALETLYVNDNQLEELPATMTKLRRLKEVRMERNRLRTWPDLSASPLRTLNLNHNLLREVPDSIANYVTLYWFSAENNQLVRVSPEVGKLPNIHMISLKQNRLKSLPSTMSNLVRLHKLDVSFNQIEELGSFVNGLSALRVLRADHNNIARIMVPRFEIATLRSLDLSYNKLTVLPGWNSGGNLHTVNVEWNQLYSLPDSNEFGKLKFLYAAHNRLESIPDALLYGSRTLTNSVDVDVNSEDDQGIATVDLSFNFINRLPPRRNRFMRFSSMSLVGNPLDHVASAFTIPDGGIVEFDSSFALGRLRQATAGNENDSKINTNLESTYAVLNVPADDLRRVFGRMLRHDEGWATPAQRSVATSQGLAGDDSGITVEKKTSPQLETMTTECWRETLRAADRRLTIRKCACAPGMYFTPAEALHLMEWMPVTELSDHCAACPSAGTCKRGEVHCDAGSYLKWGSESGSSESDPADQGREGILITGDGGTKELEGQGQESESQVRRAGRLASCGQCPTGAKCVDKSVTPMKGYWRSDRFPAVVYECETPAACEGGEESTCRTGHSGSLCSICDPGYFKSANGVCQACGSRVSSIFYIGFVVLGAAGLLSILVFLGDGMVRQLAMKKSVESLPTAGGMNAGGALSVIPMDELAAAMCRIVISFTQVIALLPRIYSVDFGSWLQYVTSLFSFLSLDILSPSSFECALESETNQLDYFMSTVVYGVVPIAVALVGIAVYLVFIVMRKAIAPKAGVQPSFLSAFLCKAVVLCWLFSYLPIALTMMEFFTCRTFDGGETYWITADVATECYSETWYAMVPFVVFVVVYFILGLPLMIFFLMFPWPRHLGSEWMNHLRERMDRSPLCILFRRMFALYRTKYQWWEAVEMLRKLLITAAALHFAGVPTVRVLVSILISFGAVVAQISFRPYQHRVLNFLQSIQLILLYLTLSLGILKSIRLEGTARTALMGVVVVCDVVFIFGLLFSVGVYLVYQVCNQFTARRMRALARVMTRR